MGRPLTTFEEKRLDDLHSERIENWLDQGHGSCALRQPGIAEMVANALRFFDGDRYELHAWCIMPNHVHAVLKSSPAHDISKILLSWKGFTGDQYRKSTSTRGEFWQKESYDHIVRDKEDLANQIRYVLNNPKKAGLVDWPWVWRRP
ncbi:MAG: transposase [Phycisphaerales bacterium]|nr:transposase [Phycisphaerales bacterium]